MERTPAHLRQCGLHSKLAAKGAPALDYGDVPICSFASDRCRTARNLAGVTETAVQVYHRCLAPLEKEQFVLLLGGDCTVTLGLVAAARHCAERLGLVYLDSQTDLNTPETTDTGILDSMGLAHMLGLTTNTLTQVGKHSPLILSECVLPFGFHPARLTQAEHQVLGGLPLNGFDAIAVAGDAERSARCALRKLEDTCDAFVAHFDIDVIDFADFPAADAPVYRGFGLPYEEALTALDVFCASTKCLGLSVTEFNSDHDADHSLGRRFVGSLAEALVNPGFKSLWASYAEKFGVATQRTGLC